MKLDPTRIAEAALQVLDEVGLDRFSTRQVAERLGVRQPALYWHFATRRALLDAMNEAMLARGHPQRRPRPDENWRGFLHANASGFRAALLSVRDGARLHAGTEAGSSDLDAIEAQLSFLGAQGLGPGEAMEALVTISRYTVGCVLEEQAEDLEAPGRGEDLDTAVRDWPLIAEAMRHYRAQGHASLFEAGLALILDGLAARLG